MSRLSLNCLRSPRTSIKHVSASGKSSFAGAGPNGGKAAVAFQRDFAFEDGVPGRGTAQLAARDAAHHAVVDGMPDVGCVRIGEVEQDFGHPGGGRSWLGVPPWRDSHALGHQTAAVSSPRGWHLPARYSQPTQQQTSASIASSEGFERGQAPDLGCIGERDRDVVDVGCQAVEDGREFGEQPFDTVGDRCTLPVARCLANLVGHPIQKRQLQYS